MQVSVETLNGLERKLTVSVPAEEIEEEVSQRLKNLAQKVKMDGFRQGKVPMNVVKQRYSDNVRQEVARDMVQSTLHQALKEKELMPAGYPAVEPEQLESGKDFRYTAVFEVFPEINVGELNKEEVDVIRAEVKDSDVDGMIEKLREQHKEWQEVSQPAAQGNKLVLDFEGYLGDEAFEGGQAQDYEVEIGSGSMIPGFEEGLVGAEAGKEFDLKVTFPEDYNHQDLAGKEATFKVNLKKVMEGKLPALDDEFAKKFNIEDGGIEALKKDIKENMTRELEQRLSSLNRENAFNKLLEKNPIDLPKALIDQEIEGLKHEMYHRIFGPEHNENEKIPDFPRSLFEDQAKRRVHLGLLFSEYVKKHELSVDEARVNARIEKFAGAYEKPEEVRSWYQGNPERMAEIEGLVMEELVSEKILEDATIVEKAKGYEEIMNPKKPEEEANQNKEGEEKGA